MNSAENARRGSTKRRIVAGGATMGLCLVLVMSILGAGQAAGQATNMKFSSGSSFPLESDVPSSWFATLREGRIGWMRWGIYAYRGRHVKAPNRTPCLQLATLAVSPGGGGGFQSDGRCGRVGISAARPILVNGGSSEQRRPPGGPVSTVDVVGIGVALSVETLKVQLQDGSEETIHTRVITQAQARASKLNLFRYAVIAKHRDVCIRKMSGFDSEGAELLDYESICL